VTETEAGDAEVAEAIRAVRAGDRDAFAVIVRRYQRRLFGLALMMTGSFFSIRERVATVLPEPFTTAPMRTLPILLVFGAMFYWLWRVRGRRTLPVLVRHDPVPVATRAK